jgi:transglutaminase-like putative cysteine protease
MSFSSYFRISSYAMLACGTLMLTVSGGIGVGLFVAYILLMVVSWKLEKTKWQLSERTGLIVVLFSLPLFYLDWKFLAFAGEARDRIGVSTLAHLILFLSAVKLLQTKADRDWVFLHLISFFEVLLAAGLSISPLFLVTLSFYLLVALSTIVAFEIKKSSQSVIINETRLLIANDSTLLRRLRKNKTNKKSVSRRLPLVAFGLLVFIFVLALPLFFVMPRYGGSALVNKGYGFSGMQVGFSDSVTLGAIGELQQGNQIVMRVRVEGEVAARRKPLRWRGVALDYFTGKGWKKSNPISESKSANERGVFLISYFTDSRNLTVQTFYLEPLDTDYLFAASRVIALQGNFSFVRRDKEDGLTTFRDGMTRTTYTVYSDTNEPDPQILRNDNEPYLPNLPTAEGYLQLPNNIDARIAELAQTVVEKAGATNRYDAARAIESHLQNNYGYSLNLRAGKNNQDPLADFLFNVREGHCEYFASSMVVMLRTQGIAARLVNGFQSGEYNGASGAYTVTQSDAHSWVEVYFPETGAWVTFDPTPAGGLSTNTKTGMAAFISKYTDALEMLWIQYVVGYDNQEQRSLASSFGKKLLSLQDWFANKFEGIKKKAKELSKFLQLNPDKPLEPSNVAKFVLIICILALFVMTIFLLLRRKLGWTKKSQKKSVVEFYERMTKILAAKGYQRSEHETPLEFANAVGFPEAMNLTLAYNRVRFGAEELSKEDAEKIDDWLREIEGKET